jgi:hypothetical protein
MANDDGLERRESTNNQVWKREVVAAVDCSLLHFGGKENWAKVRINSLACGCFVKFGRNPQIFSPIYRSKKEKFGVFHHTAIFGNYFFFFELQDQSPAETRNNS